MSHYHFLHFIPTERHHGLYGYNEVIETLTWGLQALGHTVTYGKNIFSPECVNIIFGHQIAAPDILSMIPTGSIVYNMEQYNKLTQGDAAKDSRFSFQYTAQNFEIWDYSEDNIAMWKTLDPVYPVSRVPIGYAPILTRIPKAEDQDIDVLIYGSPSPNRMEILQRLCSQGLRVVFLYGFYGQARDDLIARSKIVLNIGQYDRTFEIVRTSYLMANSKAVVADVYENISIESDITQGIMFASFEHIVPVCLHLLSNDQERNDLERKALEIIRQRDIIRILQSTFRGQLVV